MAGASHFPRFHEASLRLDSLHPDLGSSRWDWARPDRGHAGHGAAYRQLVCDRPRATRPDHHRSGRASRRQRGETRRRLARPVTGQLVELNSLGATLGKSFAPTAPVRPRFSLWNHMAGSHTDSWRLAQNCSGRQTAHILLCLSRLPVLLPVRFHLPVEPRVYTG